MGVHFSIAFLRQLLARLVPLPLVGGIRVPQTEAHHGTVVAVDVPHAMAPLDAAGCALIDDLADHPSVQDAVLGVAAVGVGHPDPVSAGIVLVGGGQAVLGDAQQPPALSQCQTSAGGGIPLQCPVGAFRDERIIYFATERKAISSGLDNTALIGSRV